MDTVLEVLTHVYNKGERRRDIPCGICCEIDILFGNNYIEKDVWRNTISYLKNNRPDSTISEYDYWYPRDKEGYEKRMVWLKEQIEILSKS